MRKHALAFALALACLTAPAPAHAVRLVDGALAPSARHQAWADRARVPTTAETLTVVPDRCPGLATLAACTWQATSAIYLPPAAGRRELLHELGHRFDYRMPDWARRRFALLVHDRRPWRSAGNSPHERFADAWALCAQRPERLPGAYATAFGYLPSERTHRTVCRLIAAAARATPGEFHFPGR